MNTATTDIFETLESDVCTYCRAWPTVFDQAEGSWLFDEDGRAYLDFFAGAGALNYGHNDPALKEALLDYLGTARVIHSLDMRTTAKREFLMAFDEFVLRPRQLSYHVQFPGPTGTNAVEAALKLARKVNGRAQVLSFTNGFHGMTLGSLSVTGNQFHRNAAGIPLTNATPLPYDDPSTSAATDFSWLRRLLDDPGSGMDRPAAIIVETVQGEGGINVARPEWLRGLADLCQQHDVLLIVDDVQMGCGRTGPFFSFELAGIVPDIVCLSKSLSGFGLPMAMNLIRPDIDIWSPGEHNGTFRGHNPAFVTATAALRRYWADDSLSKATEAKGSQIATALAELAQTVPGAPTVPRGRGMARGLAFSSGDLAQRVATAAFEHGLLVETAGSRGQVVKIMPPLTITDDELEKGLSLLGDAVRAAA
ncbi:diaminobutyrate--2-oxoglutarate transaminase [Amycolatopsis sp. GM8]|uniref:diaminobutyrate--2-oxoglutarate transaminase n=1 Tax=Amycolatopsis sp. GM8 TaxID=2896530 RepID=UPI001EFFA981|nr:diaminobutyrate--2-oxoglutarate transaminase [Amycolatopsis sp. GM8]